MTKYLQDLLEAAKIVVLTPEGKEQQPIRLLRVSRPVPQGRLSPRFAYGNIVIENPRITREMVDLAADTIGRPGK